MCLKKDVQEVIPRERKLYRSETGIYMKKGKAVEKE